ncbi:hypothetical protein HYP71_gp086 [Arthrobacter phage KBurrousTX]|uniref:Uncharacterized protein n=1 Tax=Arthrobacter phage KBurrousTX TaxID=2315608 RepID=A0A386KBG8_9CAUD|nr:hypothetical protein HYP71_gp086 [Arthrobacter phage KBurrousTX]AYD81580.1 hypothetical protein KBurrousTX_86 [Arthrobacter phage KBurrousTX]
MQNPTYPDPANAPLNTDPVTLPEVGDLVLYNTKMGGGVKVPAVVTALIDDRVCLNIMYPPHIVEDPIDFEQTEVKGTITYRPGSGIPGRWEPRP